MPTLSAMVFTKCIRRFDAGDGTAISVAKDFAFVEAPTTGTKLKFAGEDLPELEVVGVATLSPNPEIGTVTAGVAVELALETLNAFPGARERGWRLIE